LAIFEQSRAPSKIDPTQARLAQTRPVGVKKRGQDGQPSLEKGFCDRFGQGRVQIDQRGKEAIGGAGSVDFQHEPPAIGAKGGLGPACGFSDLPRHFGIL
jgi:hypothetical protein